MTLPSLSQKSNENILRDLKTLRVRECADVADIVLHLFVVESRGIYREEGYSSLYYYCVECLGYSERSAQRRISAAKALKDNPEIYDLLKSGKITLCAIGELRKVKDLETKTQLIVKSEGKTMTEVEKLVVQVAGPVEKPKKERIVPRKVEVKADLFRPEAKVEETFSVSFELSKEDMELLQEVKNLMGPCTMAQAVKRMAKEFLNNRKPKRIQNRISKPVATLATKSRYITKATKYLVRARDGGRCTYEKDGKRCSERCGLQIDHIHPFALGGSNSADNLRLLCPAHRTPGKAWCFQRVQFPSWQGMKPSYQESSVELMEVTT